MSGGPVITRFVEVTDGFAYGKFMVCRLDAAELATKTAMPDADGERLLTYGGRRRFNERTTLVVDLQIGSGFAWPLENGPIGFHHYLHHKLLPAEVRRVVCPLYLPFVLWLHTEGAWAEGAGSLEDIPRYLDLRNVDVEREAARSLYEQLAEPFDQEKLDPLGPGPLTDHPTD